MTHVLLYGPPGSGKSMLGQALAASLQMPFVDLDGAIQARAGRPIARIMEESGENGFRDLETEVLRAEVARPESIIALGGGTLLRPENHKLAEASGKVICLRVAPQVLMERLAADPNPRPLLTGNMAEQLTRLLASRADHYDSFAIQFHS